MGAYNYENFINDFARRTKKNYEKILYRYEEEEANRYEVTQLINSLFGLLIVPNEKYKYRKNGQGVRENVLKNTPAYKEIIDLIQDVKNDNRYYNSYDDRFEVSDFIRHMRNSLAHSGNKGLHFLPLEEREKISSVIFYDNDEEFNGTSEFCVELTISEIIILADNIVDMYSNIEEDEDAENKRKEYEEEIQKYRSLFQKR